ncbi:4'-phosphopantetheinyl transferase superfamily protein [Psychromonas sp. RZ5]|nr:4'-phosphopantetheinyl transferase superfamily protein [Psychromonas sp. RZ5]
MFFVLYSKVGLSVQLITSSLQQLSQDHIDLWTIDPTQLSEASIQHLQAILSTNELNKLSQFKNKRAQHTAFVARALCRLVLAHYTQLAASELIFVRNQHGKPELANNQHKVRFNLSHNNDLIILSVCVKDDIGCDIENPSRKVNVEPLTRRYFSQQEHTELCGLTNEIQTSRFFEMWTLKEAFVKATGVGISLGLDSFYFNKVSAENAIKIIFNNNYTLDKNHSWQFHQQQLANQLLAICRSSELKQKINFLKAEQLINS